MARLSRRCWCAQCRLSCPVHIVGAYFRALPAGTRPFAAVSRAMALQKLRALLGLTGVADAAQYRTHDLRRGHAQDLLERGASLAEILRAGQWGSAAFANYIEEDTLEAGAVLEAHFVESEAEDS